MSWRQALANAAWNDSAQPPAALALIGTVTAVLRDMDWEGIGERNLQKAISRLSEIGFDDAQIELLTSHSSQPMSFAREAAARTRLVCSVLSGTYGIEDPVLWLNSEIHLDSPHTGIELLSAGMYREVIALAEGSIGQTSALEAYASRRNSTAPATAPS